MGNIKVCVEALGEKPLMRVFNALQAKVMLSVELPHFKISLGQ